MEEEKKLISKIEICIEPVCRSGENPTYRAVIGDIFIETKIQ
ncbi:MAG: hypothetical protein QXJ66_07395 [Candidatus Methanomethylicia archaeon]